MGPVNIKIELEATFKFAAHNFERPITKIKYNIKRMRSQIDPKQLADLFDFVKFQNYSVFYGAFYEK